MYYFLTNAPIFNPPHKGGDNIKFKLLILFLSLILLISSIGNGFSINQSDEKIIKSSNQTQFTINEIIDAASRIKTYTETNHRLPNYVEISSKEISMPDFLRLMVICTMNINQGSSSSISLKNIAMPSNPSENLNEGNIEKSEYLDMAQRIKTFTESNVIAPNYVTSSKGEIRFENVVYFYSKILNFYKENKALPNYVHVTKWNNLDPELMIYLNPTLNCQSDNKDIISCSRNVASGSDYDKASKIFKWVRDNVKYSFYYNTKYGALGTLKGKKANCCDHSHLLIALCRAAGLPARYVHGDCTFISGTRCGHVWAQVYVNNKWYNADAISSKNSLGVIKNWNTATVSIKGYYKELSF